MNVLLRGKSYRYAYWRALHMYMYEKQYLVYVFLSFSLKAKGAVIVVGNKVELF